MLKRLLLIALLLVSGADAYAREYGYQQPYLNITGTNQLSINTLQTSGLFSPTSVATQGQPFSTVESGNPLLLDTWQFIPVASINQTGGYNFLSGVTGRTIYPNSLLLMASGTGATSTGIKVQCTGGNVLASIAVGNLVNNVNLFPLASSSLNPGVAYAQGCASGDSVFISNIGSNLATTNGIWINMPYTIQ